ncbi:MAG TPA: NADH-quinone oxidoreductase subunit L [Acidimicrobiales bacterium]|nr:NADH-quinone oxidoreductase subunit L [Acidimicrobiales bacterium]
MLDLVWLIPALPLFGFLVLVVAGRKLGEPFAGWFATLMCGGAFAASVVVFAGLFDQPADQRQFQQVLFDWLPVGSLKVQLGFLVDPLSVTMILFITGVGTLIHLYSIGYMHGDKDFSKFFVYMNLFAFSMLMLVLGNNLLVTFLGWEGVGACSYFLISFWFTDEANASAGKKAFVTNRIGDWGFMTATFLAFSATGTITYFANGSTAGLLDANTLGTLAAVTATGIAALLFFGAVGKSAQLPLYVWLPDAMAGPTPVSALIHAATMVTSGVYLMTRVSPLLAHGYTWLPATIAVVGALTAIFAATVAVAQTDIKKVLAYSTVSQLGYMFLAVGSGAYVAAIFHMVTHAFFKALLFLGSGSVIHGLHGEQDMRKMGGLRKWMPVTAVTFIVGWLAIAGIPPFAGFWSKDDILLAAWAHGGSGLWKVLWGIGFVTALLTAFYMSRQVFMVFFGKPNFETEGEHAVHPHESPWTMTLPLVVLALLSFGGGALNLPFRNSMKFLDQWLTPVVEASQRSYDIAGTVQTGLAIGTAVLCAVAILAGAQVYLRHKRPAVEPEILARAWRYDEAISAFVAGPGELAFEETAHFDRGVIDGAVNGVAGVVRWGASKLRLAQTGYIRNYALGIAVGAFILVGLFLTRAGA